MLGHSMDTLRLYEILREVQQYLGGGGGCLGHGLPRNFGISQPPKSVLRPHLTAVYVDYTAKSRRYGERTGLVIVWMYMAIMRRSLSRPFSARFAGSTTTGSAPIIR